jgi:hypothetical protein
MSAAATSPTALIYVAYLANSRRFGATERAFLFVFAQTPLVERARLPLYIHSIRQRMLRLYTQHTSAYACPSFPPRLRQYFMRVSICTYVLLKQVNLVLCTTQASKLST